MKAKVTLENKTCVALVCFVCVSAAAMSTDTCCRAVSVYIPGVGLCDPGAVGQLCLPGPDGSPPASSGCSPALAARLHSSPGPSRTPWCRGGRASSAHIYSGSEKRRGQWVLDPSKVELISSSFPISLTVILSSSAMSRNPHITTRPPATLWSFSVCKQNSEHAVCIVSVNLDYLLL